MAPLTVSFPPHLSRHIGCFREFPNFKLLPPQSPRGFSALARLYYLARPTKTAMLQMLRFATQATVAKVKAKVKLKSALKSARIGNSQLRTQACSRYPSDQRSPRRIFPTSLTGDVTSEIAEDDWERGWETRS